MKERRISVGIIGLGVGRYHLEAFKTHNTCRVKSVCDFDGTLLSRVRKKYPDLEISRDADDILKNPDIDIVSIASYDNYHFEQIVSALENGKDIFVEKPLCQFPEQAEIIRRTMLKYPDRRLSSNLNLRSCPRFIDLKARIQTGEFGDVYYMEGDYLWGRIQKLTDGWRKEMPYYSIVQGAAVHMIDLLMWLVGMKPVSIQAIANNIATKNSDFSHDDFCAITMKFDSGLVAKVTAQGGCVHPHFHRLAVFGTRQTFKHDIWGAAILNSSDPENSKNPVMTDYPGIADKKKVIHSFIDSVLNPDALPIVKTEEVFDTMAVCFAAIKAVKRTDTVEIEYG